MSASQEIRDLESELEHRRRELREDAARISGKIEETKARLSPRNFVRERALLVLGGALLLGIGVGYLITKRKVPVEALAQPAVEHLGKPMARGVLTAAGKEAATRAVHGR